MKQYLTDFTCAYLPLDCHSQISCVEEVIRVGAAFPHPPATASSPSQQVQEEPIGGEHAAFSTDDHSGDHVPGEEWKAALTRPAHIDLTTSALLLRAAIERKEKIILDHCLRTHSVPFALALR